MARVTKNVIEEIEKRNQKDIIKFLQNFQLSKEFTDKELKEAYKDVAKEKADLELKDYDEKWFLYRYFYKKIIEMLLNKEITTDNINLKSYIKQKNHNVTEEEKEIFKVVLFEMTEPQLIYFIKKYFLFTGEPNNIMERNISKKMTVERHGYNKDLSIGVSLKDTIDDYIRYLSEIGNESLKEVSVIFYDYIN